LPLAWLAKGRFALDQIEVDRDGHGVSYRLGPLHSAITASGVAGRGHTAAIRCCGMRVDDFIAAINASFVAAELDLQFAAVAARRYELHGVLVARGERPANVVRLRARGTTPP